MKGRKFLVGDEISVADVAVASYLLYVPQFFPDIDLSAWPEIIRYVTPKVKFSWMIRAAGRVILSPAFSGDLRRMLYSPHQSA